MLHPVACVNFAYSDWADHHILVDARALAIIVVACAKFYANALSTI